MNNLFQKLKKQEDSWKKNQFVLNNTYESSRGALIEFEQPIPTLDKCNFSYRRSLEVFYISDIHLVHHLFQRYPRGASNKEIRNYIDEIVDHLLSGRLKSIIAEKTNPVVLFGGDISSSFDVAKLFYESFIDKWSELSGFSPRYIYSILGNHEFWNFGSYEDCVKQYELLFQSLGIHFLNSNITGFGRYLKNPSARSFHNAIIVGGVGFAPQNQLFNADQMIYGNAIDRDLEKILAGRWLEKVNKALDLGKEKNAIVVVLSHHPVSDWLKSEDLPENCVFFTGHTHKNYRVHDEKNNYIYADNQIGYSKKRIVFKHVVINKVRNPFAGMSDGFREITSVEYGQFYDYVSDELIGTGTIEYQTDNYDA